MSKKYPYRDALKQDVPLKFASVRRKIRKRKRKSSCDKSTYEKESGDESALPQTCCPFEAAREDEIEDDVSTNIGLELVGDCVKQQHDLQELNETDNCPLISSFDERDFDLWREQKADDDVDDTRSTDRNLEFLSESEDEVNFSDSSSSDSDDFIDELDSKGADVHGDPPLYDGAPITLSASLLLALSFVLKHKITGEAFENLLAVLEIHCPKPNNCRTSVKSLFQYFKGLKGNIFKHYFCSYCKAYIGREDEIGVAFNNPCHICGTSLSNASMSFFIEAPIEDQIRKLFKDPEFASAIKYRFERRKKADENIEDVYDGKLYKSHLKPGCFLSQPHNISLKLNTDGVAVFKSSKFSVWHLFLAVNELPPCLRTKKKYRIFTGLWFGEEKPFFSTFFKPFTEVLAKTTITGIRVHQPDGTEETTKVMVLSGHFDLPARAAVLDQYTYKGHSSCCYCDECGQTVQTSARGHVMTFPFRDTPTGHAKLRTREDILTDSVRALESNTTVNGFKAPSPLFQLVNFDVPKGIAVDYMHGICLGVVKTLIELWFDSSNSSKTWYCGNRLHEVDKRLLQRKAPNLITRVPRSIEGQRKHWEASECRNWFLYYSLPCLKGILNDELYQHYALLVGGVYLLLQESISPADINKAKSLLCHYVEMIDAFFGARRLLMNQHTVLHLVKDVIFNGPLWNSSLFTFEDWNGDITGYFHGTQNVPNQIMSAVVCHQNIPELIQAMPNCPAKELVLKLRDEQKRQNRTRIGEELYMIGKPKPFANSNPGLEDDIVSGLGASSVANVQTFTRLQKKNSIIHCRQYKRMSRRNSYTISYKDVNSDLTKYGQIDVFVKCIEENNVRYGAVIFALERSDEAQCLTAVDEVLCLNPIGDFISVVKPVLRMNKCTVIMLEQIEDVCLYMEFKPGHVAYVAHFPNRFEKD